MEPAITTPEKTTLTNASKRGDFDTLRTTTQDIARREGRSPAEILVYVKDQANAQKGVAHYLAEFGHLSKCNSSPRILDSSLFSLIPCNLCIRLANKDLYRHIGAYIQPRAVSEPAQHPQGDLRNPRREWCNTSHGSS